MPDRGPLFFFLANFFLRHKKIVFQAKKMGNNHVNIILFKYFPNMATHMATHIIPRFWVNLILTSYGVIYLVNMIIYSYSMNMVLIWLLGMVK